MPTTAHEVYISQLMRYSRAFACYQNILEKRWVLKMKLDRFTVANHYLTFMNYLWHEYGAMVVVAVVSSFPLSWPIIDLIKNKTTCETSGAESVNLVGFVLFVLCSYMSSRLYLHFVLSRFPPSICCSARFPFWVVFLSFYSKTSTTSPSAAHVHRAF